LIRYATFCDINGGRHEVVGYTGTILRYVQRTPFGLA